MEIYFLNGRYVKNNFISTAVEEGYREYLMLHKFPVVFLNFTIDPSKVDVNVHPAKLDVRISDQQMFFAFVSSSIHDVMTKAEMIPENILTSDADKKVASKESAAEVASGKNPEPFELKRTGLSGVESAVKAFSQTVSKPSVTTFNYDFESEVSKAENVSENSFFEDDRKDVKPVPVPETETEAAAVEKSDAEVFLENTSFKQSQLFEDHLLDRDKRASYKIIGQVFDTYWIVQYEQQMFIIDQHAAHEKVNYERFVKRIHAGEHPTQMLMPPIIVTLTGAEEAVLNDNIESFRNIGFEIENFGGNEYALRGVPTDLFRHSEKELFLAILDELAENPGLGSFKTIDEKIAGMACKASVKGGDRIGVEQAQKLIDELLTLDNPYNCPHGRPTIISITKTEMEKKFQRIVN
jgi:DNA mismatch repair protein MutL